MASTLGDAPQPTIATVPVAQESLPEAVLGLGCQGSRMHRGCWLLSAAFSLALTPTLTLAPRTLPTVTRVQPMILLTLEERPTARTGISRWLATYGTDEDLARFEIELELATPLPETSPGVRGRLLRHAGVSHPDAFLGDLVRAHGDEDVSVETPHREVVSFIATVEGAGLKPDSTLGSIAGHFVEDPDGTWMLLRVTLEPERSTSDQILVALSPESRQGALISAGRKFAPGVLSVFGGLLLPARH